MPITYSALYLQLAAARGVATGQVLARAGLRADLLADPTARISPQEHVRLIATVVECVGDDGIGFDVGERQPLTAHGSLGYALLCCGTVTEALTVLQRFWHVRGRGVRMQCSQQADWLVFEFSEEMAMEPVVRRVQFEAIITGFYHSLRFILGESRLLGELWFDFAEPPYLAAYRARLPTLRYQMPAIRLQVPIEVCQRKLALANPEALTVAIAQCERELALLEQSHNDVLASARVVMVLGEHGYPSPEQLAAKLCMSSRTMRRRLQLQGGSYHQLLEEARRRDALALLDKVNLEIQKVAVLLGYHNPANFTRAFKMWTGQTPSQYRTQRLASS